MTVIAVAAGTVTAKRTTSATTAVSTYVSGRCRQQVHMGKAAATVQCTIAGGADEVQLMLVLLDAWTRSSGGAVRDLSHYKAGTGQVVCTEGFLVDGSS